MTCEVLATTRRPPIQAAGPQQRLAQLVGAVVAFATLLAFALGSGESGPEEGILAPDGPSAVRIVVLGDSSAGRGSCAGCPVYGELIADAVRRDGRAAYLDDRTWSANAWPSANLAGMTGALRADPVMSGMVAGADLIVLAMGVYDVGWSTAPDASHRPSAFDRLPTERALSATGRASTRSDGDWTDCSRRSLASGEVGRWRCGW